MAFVLGSGSPRRLELLKQIGLTPDAIRSPDIDEAPLPGELPRSYCSRIALEKLTSIEVDTDCVVLCADTTVSVGRRILGKPSNRAEAETFLRLMSGRRHRVITAVAVRSGEKIWSKDVVSSVRMKVLSDREIESYLVLDDWQGKAGGYGIQGPASAFIPWIKGSFTGIVGLPLAETARLLETAGMKIWK